MFVSCYYPSGKALVIEPILWSSCYPYPLNPLLSPLPNPLPSTRSGQAFLHIFNGVHVSWKVQVGKRQVTPVSL